MKIRKCYLCGKRKKCRHIKDGGEEFIYKMTGSNKKHQIIDVCLTCKPKTKKKFHPRTVWLVLDKDGNWFRDYEGKYNIDKMIINKP